MKSTKSKKISNDLPATVPPCDPSFPYFALTFRDPNQINLIMASDSIVELIRRISEAVFRRSLEYVTKSSQGCRVISYYGHPFSADFVHEECIFGRQLVTRMLKALYMLGWDVLASNDVARYDDHGTWFLQKACDKRPQPVMFCVSQNGARGLQLVDCPATVKDALATAIAGDSYSATIVKSKSLTSAIHELEFGCNLWYKTNLQQDIFGKRLLLTVFRVASASGFHLHATANMTGTTDSLFFIQPANRVVVNQTVNSPAEKFCLICLLDHDTLRLIDCPQPLVEVVGQTVHRLWPKVEVEGLLKARSPPDAPVYGFQLKGEPWFNPKTAVPVRVLLTEMFETLLTIGWCLTSAIDVSGGISDTSVFVLRQCPPANMYHMCISLMDTGDLHVIRGKPSVVKAVHEVVDAAWPPGLQSSTAVENAQILQLSHEPWAKYSNFGRVLLLYLLNKLYLGGWRVIASGDVSSQYYQPSIPTEKERNRSNIERRSFKIDPHCWFMVYVGNYSDQ